MAWSLVGTVSPSYDWQTLPTPIVNYALFRITHSYQGENPGRLMIRNLFADGGALDFATSIPEPTPQLFELPLSEAVQNATLGIRYLQVKMPVSARVYENTNWSITVDVWV